MKKKCAILLSRQSLHPSRSTLWVRQTLKAIQWVKKNQLQILTSIGQSTWEFIVFLAQKEQINQIIYIPAKHSEEFDCVKNDAIQQFHLNNQCVSFIPVFPKTTTQKGIKQLPYCRDKSLVNDAEIVIPISIRPNGYMDQLIHLKHETFRMTQFQIRYQKRQDPIAYRVDPNHLSNHIRQLNHRYIIHWTRSSNGPWPTESKSNYYQAISQSDDYPRQAYYSLCNILKTKVIKASCHNMPRKTPIVSFSSLHPKDAISLMRWRSRFCHMSFEPYGIGIDKELASKINIHPVIYYEKSNRPLNSPYWLLQSRGIRSDWRVESEYRHLGDFDLNSIPWNHLICFCYKPHEAEMISKQFEINTVALTSAVAPIGA